MTLPSGDARDVISTLGLTSEDEDYDYWLALQEDELFTTACRRFKDAALYAGHEDATQHDRDVRDAAKRAVREHAQRVMGGL